ncbi:MAG TPA: hypothetical protein VEK07_19065 [Polyangiaceae bacterium]|nr:hypothetical protein [Polyangiaceae bacterium]
MLTRFASLAAAVALVGCAGRPSQMPSGADFREYVVDRQGASGRAGFEWRPDVCAHVDVAPDYRNLNETSLVAFLRGQQIEARVERQPVETHKPDLVFVFVTVPGVAQTVPLRVAILPSADEAGRALYDALVQRGAGAWGVHRSNVAVLGPLGSNEDDVAFAAKTRLACWGTFTFADSGDAFVVPGGYAEP